jgi:hypothetical protein
MHPSESHVRRFAAVAILLVAFLSTSAMADPVTMPTKNPGDLGGGFLVDAPLNLANASGGERMAQAAASKTTSDAGAGPTEGKTSSFPETTFDVNLSAGYRVDDLNWNIAISPSGTTTPNILSELTWEDLEILQFKADAKIIMGRLLYLRGSLAYGSIFDGQNQDSDYAGDDRTLEWSRSNSSADEGNVLDASLGIGYQLRFSEEKFRIAGLVGYSYHEQNLTMTKGVQTLKDPANGALLGILPGEIPDVGTPLTGLNNAYDTEWDGPWLGIDLSYRPGEKWAFMGTFEYHWADYYAEATWNLRTTGRFALAQPKSFEHEADGDGIIASLGCDYRVSEGMSLNLILDYQDWTTDPGIDRTFFASGAIGETRLNEVNWESYSIMLGLAFYF